MTYREQLTKQQFALAETAAQNEHILPPRSCDNLFKAQMRIEQAARVLLQGCSSEPPINLCIECAQSTMPVPICEMLEAINENAAVDIRTVTG